MPDPDLRAMLAAARQRVMELHAEAKRIRLAALSVQWAAFDSVFEPKLYDDNPITLPVVAEMLRIFREVRCQ